MAQGVLQFVGQHQFFLSDLGEFEQHIFQGDIEQVAGVAGRFDGIFQVEQVEVVAGFAVELAELVKVQLLQQAVFPLQANQVVEVARIGQCLFKRQHGGAVLNLAELARKLFGVFNVEAEQNVFDGFDFLRNFFGRLEQVGVMLNLAAQFRLQFFKIVLVGLVEFLADIGKVHHIAVAKILVRAVHTGQRLQEVVRLDDAAQVQLFQALGIKAGEQHVVNKQEVDLAVLEVLHPVFALLLAAHVVQDQRGIFDPVFQQGAGGVAIGLRGSDQGLTRVLCGVGKRGQCSVHRSEDAEHLPRLFGAVADHHAADTGIAQCAAALFEVPNDVIEHGLDKLRVRVDQFAVDIALLQRDGGERLLQRDFVVGGDFFADQAQGVAIGDGSVVVVLVDVVAKQHARVVVVAQERCACEADLDGVAVRLAEVGQKTALWVVAAMHLVQKINALDAEVVVLCTHHVWVVLKLLDIDHGDFRLAAVVVQHLRGFDVARKRFAAVDGVHHQSATCELALRLNEQIQPVNNEIELRNDAFALEVIGEEAGVVVGQRGFTAALGVPDDALLDPGIEFSLDGLGGKKLGVAHHMFVQAVTLVHVGQRKAQQESQAFTTEQRGAEAVGRRIGRFVAQKLGAVLDNVEVVVAQHIVFEGVIFICQKLGEVQRFLFAEIVENGGVIGGAGIERTLNRLR